MNEWKQIKNISELFDKICHQELGASFNDDIIMKFAQTFYNAGYCRQSDLSPCDCCSFNPPSSFGGKPCCACPAQAKIIMEE